MTKAQKYGNPNYQNIEAIKSTCLERYGVDNYAKTTMWLDKYIKHSLETYGTRSPNQSDIVKKRKIEGIQRKYGKQYISVSQVPEIKKKIIEKMPQSYQKAIKTMKRNHSYGKSKQEDTCYHMLHFIYPHLVRQYYSKEYPFACDFYDPDSSTYFEFNGSWTHGGHWFDEANEEDLKTLQRWKDKETKYYQNAIETWTVRDVKKREAAMKNGLKYIVFWSLDEVHKFAISWQMHSST